MLEEPSGVHPGQAEQTSAPHGSKRRPGNGRALSSQYRCQGPLRTCSPRSHPNLFFNDGCEASPKKQTSSHGGLWLSYPSQAVTLGRCNHSVGCATESIEVLLQEKRPPCALLILHTVMASLIYTTQCAIRDLPHSSHRLTAGRPIAAFH